LVPGVCAGICAKCLVFVLEDSYNYQDVEDYPQFWGRNAMGAARKEKPIPSSDEKQVIGIDLGGTNFKIAVVTPEGEILAQSAAHINRVRCSRNR
jgi:activator of 2-hydroxyglutaryl-CoA dehydratase